MSNEVPVTEARARFSELVNRVGYGHERITLTRHGKPLVTLVPADAISAGDNEQGEGTVLDLASTATSPTPHSSYSLIAQGPQSPRG